MSAAPVNPAPAWVRPVYLYLVCLVGNLVMIYGAVSFALGVVNTAAPKTDPTPITQIGHALIDVVGDVAVDLGEAPPELSTGLEAARSALDRSARNRGVSRMVIGAVTFLVGLVAFLLAWRRANAEAGLVRPAMAAQPGAWPPSAAPPGAGPLSPAPGPSPWSPPQSAPPPGPAPGPPTV